MIDEAGKAGLEIEGYLRNGLKGHYAAKIHQSRKHIYRSKPRFYRDIMFNNGGSQKVYVHDSVLNRQQDGITKYAPKNLMPHIGKFTRKVGDLWTT